MKHLSEEELYALSQEPDGAGHAHLRECPQCAAAYDEIKHLLEGTIAASRMSEPPADYGEKVFAAIQASLPVYGQQQLKRKWNWWRQNGRLIFAVGAACLALVAGAFWAGSAWQQRQVREETAKWNRGAPGRVVFVVVEMEGFRRHRRFERLIGIGQVGKAEHGGTPLTGGDS